MGDKIYEELPQVDFEEQLPKRKTRIPQRVKEAEKQGKFNDLDNREKFKG